MIELTPAGARFSELPKSYRTRREAMHSKISKLKIRAVLFTYSYYEQSFPWNKKFQMYTLLRF